ncbi:hypothetical protein [Halobacterium wangiae]|uniref:hypothetical protein n=1 Tax=Halobacterium wangiae TaxID=2902623 RepID=UPI001E3C0AF0|nr:hypothetical protein [Halobacterium wangiae]
MMFEDDGSEETNPIIDRPAAEDDSFEDPIGDLDLDIGDSGIPVAGEGDVEEVDDVDEEGVLCDCDPEYRHPETVLKERGASLGGLGGQFAEETTVIICTNCGTRFYENESYRNDNSGAGSLI